MILSILILASISTNLLHFNALPPEKTGVNVKTVCQDNSGNMWFGGMDGITRFDGNHYTIFNHGNEHANLPDNHVYKLICDSRGDIWASHISGLSRFDKQLGSFEYYQLEGSVIKDILEISDERFLLANRDSTLLIFDKCEKKFIRDLGDKTLAGYKANCLYRTGSSLYIGGIDGTLVKTDINLKNCNIITIAGLGETTLNCFLKAGEDSLYVGTEGRGIWLLTGGQSIQTNSKPLYVRTLCFDETGQLWAGTKSGLLVIKDGRATTFHHDYFEHGSISHESILDIFRDRQGSLWLGTYYGGVCYHIPNHAVLPAVKPRLDGDFPYGFVLSDITEAADGSIWIGTNSGRIEHIGANGSVNHYNIINEESAEAVDVKCIFQDHSDGKMYVGGEKAALYCLDKYGSAFKPVSKSSPINIYAIEDDCGRGMFLGTTNGLYYFDKQKLSFTKIVLLGNLSNIKALKMDSDGNLWIGSKFGACAINWDSGKVLDLAKEIKESLYVEDFLEDSKGNMWLSTNEGLFFYSKDRSFVRIYNSSDGLPDNVVNGAEEDAAGNIWISTNRGLCYLDPTCGEVHNFTTDDGLTGTRFTSGSHCRTRSGEMLFGGVHALCRFNPSTPVQKFDAVQASISSVEVDGSVRKVVNGAVELEPDERNITIWFSAPDYISRNGGTFYYRLSELKEEWHKVGVEKKAEYYKLKPGRYTFNVRYRNSSGEENDAPTMLCLIIKPHWYETMTFKLSIVLLAFLLALGAVMRFISKKEEKYKSEMNKLRSDLLREFSLEFVKLGGNNGNPTDVLYDFDKSDETFIRKAMQVVKDNLSNVDFSIDDFAAAMNMSRSNLHVRCKKTFGVSALEFIKTIRFNEACRMLLEKEEPISEIGYKVGFASPSYFASAFKHFMKCSPSEYVEKHSS